MTRCFKSEFGMSPSETRVRAAAARPTFAALSKGS
jgi:hypothetical protein